jgi:eukaryotic-like serine/threonine-protein kinase
MLEYPSATHPSPQPGGKGTASPWTITDADEFLDGLRASGLLPAEQTDTWAARLSGLDRAPVTAEACADLLVRERVLTRYQADQILLGEGDGLVLGQYRLLEKLGTGGMGRVFKAEHALMKRVVALKVIDPHGHSTDEHFGRATPAPGQPAASAPPDPETTRRFRREIEATARLRHPNIVAAYDAGEARGCHFLVMEYVEGVDLNRLVALAGPLPVRLASECVRQVLRGLACIHEHGLVHGDVKPSNLVLCGFEPTPDRPLPSDHVVPHVKILDLGLACRAGTRLRNEVASASADAEVVLRGTLDYMAPELALASPRADIRCDLYSLGCTWYFLVTGQVPYPGSTWMAKLLRHQVDYPTPVRERRPEVGPKLAGLMERLMARDPADRFPTPADGLARLEQCLANRTHGKSAGEEPKASSERYAEPSAETAPRSGGYSPGAGGKFRGRRRWRGGAAVLAACLLLALCWILWPASGRSPSASRQPASAARSLPPGFFRIVGRTDHFATLASAVSAARDGDILSVEGDGPFRSEAIRFYGKSLTLQAGHGFHPKLYFTGSDNKPRTPLLATDRYVRMEGLELHREYPATGPSPVQPAYMVYCNGGSIDLHGCRFEDERGGALVACRGCGQVVLEKCRLRAGSPAVCVQPGPECRGDIRLADNDIQITDRGAAALSFWGEKNQSPAGLSIDLENNRIEAGRIAAFTNLRRDIEVTARGNRFTFDQAILSFAGLADADAWIKALTWRGQQNTYEGGDTWISLEGRDGAVRNLDEWRRLWPGSDMNSMHEQVTSQRVSRH